jgi:hypothetical protein
LGDKIFIGLFLHSVCAGVWEFKAIEILIGGSDSIFFAALATSK